LTFGAPGGDRWRASSHLRRASPGAQVLYLVIRLLAGFAAASLIRALRERLGLIERRAVMSGG
jgi:hypothetical protein